MGISNQSVIKLQSTFFNMDAQRYQTIMRDGIPEEWRDTMHMQNSFESAAAKGWQVDMRWGESEHMAKLGLKGTGAYCMQPVKKGQVLRKGVQGENLILAQKLADFPTLSLVFQKTYRECVNSVGEIWDFDGNLCFSI